MTNYIYYSTAIVDENTAPQVLPKYLQKHAYKAESVNAWALLIQKYKEVFKSDLPTVSFLESGKPVLDFGYISISHSNGMVAVCFSKEVEVGIDVEVIKSDVPKNLKKLLGEENPKRFFSKWTMREAVIKAKNYSALKKGAECEFVGFTDVFTVNEKAFSLSVYGENATFIKV